MNATAPLGTGAMLLSALERTGPHPVAAWYGEAARIELSGHVLANWVIKSIGHLDGELAFEPGDSLLVDLPPHWKRLVLALAAWSMGGSVHMASPSEASAPSAPQVVATDRPASDTAEAADEVLALEAVSLAPRFSGDLPPLVHDWAAEVRAFADQLGVALPAWSGPQPSPAGSGVPSDAAPGASVGSGTPAGYGAPLGPGTQAPPRLLVAGDGLESAPATLAALLAGGGIVGPAEAVGEQQARDEGVTARA